MLVLRLALDQSFFARILVGENEIKYRKAAFSLSSFRSANWNGNEKRLLLQVISFELVFIGRRFGGEVSIKQFRKHPGGNSSSPCFLRNIRI